MRKFSGFMTDTIVKNRGKEYKSHHHYHHQSLYSTLQNSSISYSNPTSVFFLYFLNSCKVSCKFLFSYKLLFLITKKLLLKTVKFDIVNNIYIFFLSQIVLYILFILFALSLKLLIIVIVNWKE